ncbi:flagellar export chaperone FlgN [Pectinatus frisingensis]|uniref:flagellar export chaperone FlgN n=1 Tax=Pectinatus frisingensis TaxID=865 RepID=UPI0018C543BE|nr:flagellar export chaperone FlgN [Pectinatus frisingensis]
MANLIDILKKQVEKYEALKKNMEIQKKLLIEKNVNSELFHMTTCSLEQLMNEIKLLERNKQNILRLDTIMTSGQQAEIDKLTKGLRKQAKLIKKINECNKLLLKNKMECIQFNVNILTRSTADGSYQPHGDMPGKSINKIKMFDKSI